VVADSGYANQLFLRLFLTVKTLCGLVRLCNNQVLYEAGSVRQRRGRNRVHGNPFRLAAPARPPDRREELALPGCTVCLQAWHDLHLQKLAALPGTVIQVRMLGPDGKPRHLKGPGRPAGFIPKPRPRYPVIVKGRKATKAAAPAVA
jgi:hypothetical protein